MIVTSPNKTGNAIFNVSAPLIFRITFVIPGGFFVRFYYYVYWKRFVLISSAADEYRACAETIVVNTKQHELKGMKIVHHYDEVSLSASESDIDAILSSIVHEARSKSLMIDLCLFNIRKMEFEVDTCI